MLVFGTSGLANHAQLFQYWREAVNTIHTPCGANGFPIRAYHPIGLLPKTYGGVDRSRSCTSLFRGQRFSKPPELPILALPRKSGADEGHRTPMLLNFARLFENRVYTNSTTSAKLWCGRPAES